MRRVFKYQIRPGPFGFKIPGKGFKVIHVALQRNEPTMWMEVDTDDFGTEKSSTYIQFETLPTGAEVPTGADHVGSWLMHDDSLVWHLYCVHSLITNA